MAQTDDPNFYGQLDYISFEFTIALSCFFHSLCFDLKVLSGADHMLSSIDCHILKEEALVCLSCSCNEARGESELIH